MSEFVPTRLWQENIVLAYEYNYTYVEAHIYFTRKVRCTKGLSAQQHEGALSGPLWQAQKLRKA